MPFTHGNVVLSDNCFMETNTAQQPPVAWFRPMAGWETATRWNAATFDCMTQALQQWMALLTTVPPALVVPVRAAAAQPQAAAPATRQRSNLRVHAAAKSEPRQPKRRSRARSTRSRG